MIDIPDKIYIIHYTKLVDRLERLTPTLNGGGVHYEVIKSYDQEDISVEDMSRFVDINEQNFMNKISALWDSRIHHYRLLKKSEISCAMKHYHAMNNLVYECSNYGFIIEDDAIFKPSFAQEFKENMYNTPDDWDIIFLGTGCGMGYINSRLAEKSTKRISDNVFKMGHPASNCSESYLIKPFMAKKLLESLPFNLSYDWELAYQLYKHAASVYWWIPPLISQGSKNGKYQSAIDWGNRG